MIIDVVMPKMGESITEGTILEWYKKIGDEIEQDETLLEIGTDKVDSEIPSPSSGVITMIMAEPNDVVDVGEVIAKIETDSESVNLEKISNEKDVDVAAEDLRLVRSSFDEFLGIKYPDDLLGDIFNDFCIGK